VICFKRIDTTLMMPTAIVAYLVLFAGVGFLFVFASLLLGKFLRAHSPTPLKLEVYECGEPAVGPGTVQFDLRFYVVALVFLVFEVEVAMFFPTAIIFGKAEQILDPTAAITVTTVNSSSGDTGPQQASERLSPLVANTYRELGVPPAARPSLETASAGPQQSADAAQQVRAQFHTLATASMLDLGVFFAVLLVGFAFVWSRGDLDWVRAVRHPPTSAETATTNEQLWSETAR
jgi:NADH-quinone oxidoreductase subunit A